MTHLTVAVIPFIYCMPLLPFIGPISQYASYLKDLYKTHLVVRSDKFAPTRSVEFIKLALVKKEKVNRAEADNFIRLTLQGDIDQILQVKKPIEMDDILKADDNVRLVVVEGAPGIGKSTLAWELCRQWPTLESLKRFSLVVHHKLREEGVQSAKEISDLFPCKPKPGLSKCVADEIADKFGKDVLFVFDGFDELPDYQRKSVESSIMQAIARLLLPRATILVTSRPSATADLEYLLETAISKCIEIVGFSKAEINKYAESVLSPEILASFNAYLSANPAVKGMMYNPFNCAMIVSNYKERYDESGKPVPHTQTQLYTELTLCLLCRYLNATGDPLATKLPDNLEDLPHDSDLYQQLVKVAKLAFERKPKYAQISKLPEGCSDLGLLVERTVQYTRKKTTTYNFFHLTLQEYMSAFHISQCQPDEQRTWFSEHSASMDVVGRFVAGLTKMQNIGWEEFKRIKRERTSEYGYECEYKMKDDVVTVGPFLLQCLYEAQESKRIIFSQRSVAFQMLPKDSTEDGELSNVAYALGYCISICRNAWNVKVGNISRKSLEMLGHGMKSVDYGGGSIEELDFTQCEGIMNDGKHLLQIPHQILKCIKSLTLRDSAITQIGLENLAKCIPYLHNLTSLHISEGGSRNGMDISEGGNGKLHPASRILRDNTSLKELTLHIPLDKDEVRDIIDSLKDNHSLERLNLSKKYHSQYDRSLDRRISFS